MFSTTLKSSLSKPIFRNSSRKVLPFVDHTKWQLCFVFITIFDQYVWSFVNCRTEITLLLNFSFFTELPIENESPLDPHLLHQTGKWNKGLQDGPYSLSTNSDINTHHFTSADLSKTRCKLSSDVTISDDVTNIGLKMFVRTKVCSSFSKGSRDVNEMGFQDRLKFCYQN